MARGFWFRFSAFLKERHWIIQNIMIPLGFSPLYLNDIEKRQTPKPKTVINKDCESNTELHLYMHFQHDMWIQYKQKLKLSRTVSIVCCWLNKRILRLSFWVCLVFFSGFFFMIWRKKISFMFPRFHIRVFRSVTQDLSSGTCICYTSTFQTCWIRWSTYDHYQVNIPKRLPIYDFDYFIIGDSTLLHLFGELSQDVSSEVTRPLF